MNLKDVLDRAYDVLGDDPENPRWFARQDLIDMANRGALIFRSQTAETWHRIDVSTDAAPVDPINPDEIDPSAPRIQTMGYLYYTYDTTSPTNWTTTAIQGVPFLRGYNYKVWRAFFKARGLEVQENGTGGDYNGTAHVYEYVIGGHEWVQLRGVGVFHYGSALNWCMYGHTPPTEHMAETKRLSKIGTKVGVGLLNFESINQRIQFGIRDESLRVISRTFPLSVGLQGARAGVSTYGCPSIDKEEQRDIVPRIAFTANPGTDVLTASTHGLANNDRIVFTTTGTLPGPLQAPPVVGGVRAFFVINVAGDDFQVSNTQAGPPVDITTAGTGTHYLEHRHGMLPADYMEEAVACPHTPAHNSLPAHATVGGPHYWECDVGDAGYIVALSAAANFTISNYYGTGYDFELWDNANDPYKRQAFNDFPVGYSTEYTGTRDAVPANRKGWKGFWQTRREATPGRPASFIWSNSGYYDAARWTLEDLSHRWSEYFFAVFGTSGPVPESLVALEARIQAAAALGITMISNVQYNQGVNIEAWALTPGPGGAYGTWAELYAYLVDNSLTPYFMACCARDSSYIFWQSGMQELVV